MGIGFVGLHDGRAARRLVRAGMRVLGFDAAGHGAALAEANVTLMPSAVALARALSPPRVVWLDVPAGVATELAIADVWPEMAAGDVIVDAGPAHFADARRRAAALATVGIHFVDCALRHEPGAMLTGGHPDAAPVVAPYAALLAPGSHWRHCGPAGAAHYARMVLAGVGVAVAAARAEGLALLAARREFALDATAIAASWNADAMPLHDVAPPTIAGGTVNAAMEHGVAAPVLSLALMLAFAAADAPDANDGGAATTRESNR
jgi:6-phosphogluconate dehydrogenase